MRVIGSHMTRKAMDLADDVTKRRKLISEVVGSVLKIATDEQ